MQGCMQVCLEGTKKNMSINTHFSTVKHMHVNDQGEHTGEQKILMDRSAYRTLGSFAPQS